MKRAILLGMLGMLWLPLLSGCDVAVGVYFATKKKSSTSKAPNGPPPDTRFFIWMANLATSGDGDTQETAMQGNGNPSAAVWTQVGNGTKTTEITAGLPAGMNTILIQVTANQQYEIDAMEILDANGTVIDWGNTKAWAVGVTGGSVANDFLKTPDGKTVNSAATPAQKSVVFARSSTASITGFRVSLWAPGARTSGDVVWSKTLSPRPGDEIAGGMAVSGSGVVVASFSDSVSKNTHFYRLDSDGTVLGLTDVESNTAVTGGAPSVAIDNTGGLIYVASLVTPIATSEENFEVKSYSLSNPLPPGTGFSSSILLGKERIEAHGITLDNSRNLVIGGGAPRVGEGVNHWIRKLDPGPTQLWEILEGPGGTDTIDSYWTAVTTDAGNNVYVAGYINSALEDVRIMRVTAGGTPTPAVPRTEGTASNDRASSIAVDNAGNLYVGGFLTRSGQKNAVLFKYDSTTITPAAAGFPIEHDGPAGTDDEILDLAVDNATGFVYAVGYETVSVPNQGKNMWITKYDPAGNVLWTRTHHEALAAAGDDRAVSVRIDGAFLVVSGEVTLGGGGTDIHVRKYVK